MDRRGTPRTFVAHLDRGKIDRQYAVICAVWTVLALTGVAGFVLLLHSGDDLGVAAGAPLIVTAISLINLAVYVWIWTTTRRLVEPFVASTAGVLFRTPRGEVEVPWEAVRAITISRVLGRPQLNVQLHPAAGPGAPGVRTTLSPGGWRTVRRAGLRLSLRLVREPVPVVSTAIAELSRGRFVVTSW